MQMQDVDDDHHELVVDDGFKKKEINLHSSEIRIPGIKPGSQAEVLTRLRMKYLRRLTKEQIWLAPMK